MEWTSGLRCHSQLLCLRLISYPISGFPLLLESPGFFYWKFQDLESPGKSLWSWKLKLNVLEKYPWKSCIFRVVQTENKQRYCSTQFLLTIASLNTMSTFCFMLNVLQWTTHWMLQVNAIFFFIFKHSLAPNRSWKIIHGVLAKSWVFLSVKVGTLSDKGCIHSEISRSMMIYTHTDEVGLFANWRTNIT